MKTLAKIFLVLAVIVISACNDQLTELNVNPNGVDPSTVNPNLMIPTIITNTMTTYLDNNYQGDVAGVMQYVQKSGWGNGLNKLDWNTQRDWSGYYNTLRDAKHLYERADKEGMEFHKGVATVIRAFNFAYIADAWGDAPYTKALNAANGGQEDLFPAFDTQETIYKGIIEELKQANTILSKSVGEYKDISKSADVIYGGDPAKWRKLANSLMLRYYMRLSAKLPDYAKAGIQEIMSNQTQYPVFTSNADDATMAYIGTSSGDSWPANTVQDVSMSNFDRIQLCAGFRDELVKRNDPRIGVWFNKVRTRIKVSTQYPDDDIVVGNIRYLRPEYLQAENMVVYDPETWVDAIKEGKTLVDTMEYVGMPIASSTGDGSNYNLNPNPIQGGPNVHNSALNDMYKAAKGDKLKARLISYSEVCFILAEAANKGWSVGGTQKDWYDKGIKASMDTWGVGDSYTNYIAQAGVAHNGTLEQIMIQKWIANWTMAHESWCDWRRTGYPVFKIGSKGVRDAMPLRYEYGGNEIARNNANYSEAIKSLVETPYTATDGKDSSWSKFWLIQGTNKPY